MKLIAEIETTDGRPVSISCEGDVLTVADWHLPLSEFREALDAVAPRKTAAAAKPASGRYAYEAGQINRTMDLVTGLDGTPTLPLAPTRAPDGARIGPSPRFAMRAAKPEANVEEEPTAEEETAA